MSLLLALAVYLISGIGEVQAQVVNVVPQPSEVFVDVGDSFSITIQIQPVDGALVSVADIAMSFDPALVQATSVALAPGTLLPFPTFPAGFDNSAGTLFTGGFNFAAVSTNFDHAIFQFSAVAPGTTTIAHILEGLPATALAYAGFEVTGSTNAINVTIAGEPVLDCAGVPDGTAFLDECGTCVGGTTGLEACEADCEGVFGGDALPGTPCTDANNAEGTYGENCECVPNATCTANGGTLEAPANRSFCVGTGSPKSISVTASGASGTNQRWALIDVNGNVLETRANNSSFNLDTRPPGNYTIRYIRFENDVTNINTITNISQVNTLVGCYGLASNAITLFLRDEPVGGILTALSTTTICPNAGNDSRVQVELVGNSGEFSRFGVVDLNDNGRVVANQAGTNINFNNLPAGNYRIFHLSYQQGVNISNIEFQNQLQGCFDASNPINVTVVGCAAAATLTSLPNPTDGPSAVTFTLPETIRTTLEVYDMSGRLVQSLFSGVAEEGLDYRFDFDGSYLPNGVYLYRLTTESEVKMEKFIIAR